MKRTAFLGFVLMTATACSTLSGAGNTRGASEEGGPIVPANYERMIELYSDGDTQFSGFYNNFEYKATLLNSTVRGLLLERQADYYQWDEAKREDERRKSDEEMAAETVVFLSFFTPERRNDNLSDSRSIWRVYLEVGGRRYLGKAQKVRSLLAELQAQYPYHTRWNSAYRIKFPVPTNAVESQPSSLTVTGPLGTRTVKFAANR